jgi:hypothetical protein
MNPASRLHAFRESNGTKPPPAFMASHSIR